MIGLIIKSTKFNYFIAIIMKLYKNLKTVYLTMSQVSDEQKAELKKALPHANIL